MTETRIRCQGTKRIARDQVPCPACSCLSRATPCASYCTAAIWSEGPRFNRCPGCEDCAPATRIINGVLFTRGVPSAEEIAENEAKHGDLTSDDAKPLTCAWLAIHDAPAKRCPKVAVVELFTTEEDAGGEAGTWMMVPGFTPAFSRPDHLGKWAEEAWWTPLSWMRLPVRLASEDDLRAWREDAIARRFPDDLNASPGSLRLKVYGLLADYAEHMKRPRA